MEGGEKENFSYPISKVYTEEKLTNDLLYNITKTIPGRAKYHDSPLVFNMELKHNYRMLLI